MNERRREQRADDLLRWLTTQYFTTPATNEIARELTSTVDRNFYSPPGAKTISAITGPNGLGKSTLVRFWAERQYLRWTTSETHDKAGFPVWNPSAGVTADLCPIAWANLQADARVKELDAQILEFFGLPSEGVARTLTNRVVRAMARHQVRVLVIDDAHLLQTSSQQGRAVLDHLKHLNTQLGEFGASLILIGANLTDGELVRDPQIEARLRLHRIEACNVATDSGREIWQACLLKLERLLNPHLPNLEREDLHRKNAQLLWDRTGGRLGQLSHLISEAAARATLDGSGRITKTHICAVPLSEQAEREYKARIITRKQKSKKS